MYNFFQTSRVSPSPFLILNFVNRPFIANLQFVVYVKALKRVLLDFFCAPSLVSLLHNIHQDSYTCQNPF